VVSTDANVRWPDLDRQSDHRFRWHRPKGGTLAQPRRQSQVIER